MQSAKDELDVQNCLMYAHLGELCPSAIERFRPSIYECPHPQLIYALFNPYMRSSTSLSAGMTMALLAFSPQDSTTSTKQLLASALSYYTTCITHPGNAVSAMQLESLKVGVLPEYPPSSSSFPYDNLPPYHRQVLPLRSLSRFPFTALLSRTPS